MRPLRTVMVMVPIEPWSPALDWAVHVPSLERLAHVEAGGGRAGGRWSRRAHRGPRTRSGRPSGPGIGGRSSHCPACCARRHRGQAGRGRRRAVSKTWSCRFLDDFTVVEPDFALALFGDERVVGTTMRVVPSWWSWLNARGHFSLVSCPGCRWVRRLSLG